MYSFWEGKWCPLHILNARLIAEMKCIIEMVAVFAHSWMPTGNYSSETHSFDMQEDTLAQPRPLWTILQRLLTLLCEVRVHFKIMKPKIFYLRKYVYSSGNSISWSSYIFRDSECILDFLPRPENDLCQTSSKQHWFCFFNYVASWKFHHIPVTKYLCF